MNSNKRVPTKPTGPFPGTVKVPPLHLNDEPIVTPKLTLSDLRRKPRRSMLGRRRPTLLASQTDETQMTAQPPASPLGAIFNVAKPRWSTIGKTTTPLLASQADTKLSMARHQQSSSAFIFNVPKPRRSMLGRKNLPSANSEALKSFPKPVGTSSPTFQMCASTPLAGHENPFDDQSLDSSAFFKGESNFSTWSIFKKSDVNTLDVPKKTRPITRPLVFDPKSEPSQEAQNDSSFGVEPLSSSIECDPEEHEITYQYELNEERCEKEIHAESNLEINKTESEQKSEITIQDEENTVVENCQLRSSDGLKLSSGKKLSVITEDDCITEIFIPAKVLEEEPPVTPEISSETETIEAPQSKISVLINKWEGLYSQWQNQCKVMDSMAKEINECLQSIKLESRNSNEGLNDETDKENFPLREMRKSMFNNYKSQFSLIQTPKNVKVNKPSTSTCYTPNSFSARVTSAMKDIYN